MAGEGCDLSSLAASQIRMIPSDEPMAMRAPSGEKATDNTMSMWPVRALSSMLRAASHTLRAVSEPEAMRVPSGEKATACTASVWPVMVRIRAADSRTGITERSHCGASGLLRSVSSRARTRVTGPSFSGPSTHCSRLYSCCHSRSGLAARICASRIRSSENDSRTRRRSPRFIGGSCSADYRTAA